MNKPLLALQTDFLNPIDVGSGGVRSVKKKTKVKPIPKKDKEQMGKQKYLRTYCL